MLVGTGRKTLEIELSKIIARSWIDEEFYQQFVKDPKATLEEAGLKLEDFLDLEVTDLDSTAPTLKAVADEKTVYEIMLPLKPIDLTDEDIQGSFRGTVPCSCNGGGPTTSCC